MKPPRTDALQGTEGQLKYFLELMAKVLDHNISFGNILVTNPPAGQPTLNSDPSQNMDCFKAAGQAPGVANTEFSITAGAGNTFFRDKHIPIGFLVISVDAAAIIYKSTSAWTASTIFLKSSIASVNYALIIL